MIFDVKLKFEIYNNKINLKQNIFNHIKLIERILLSYCGFFLWLLMMMAYKNTDRYEDTHQVSGIFSIDYYS